MTEANTKDPGGAKPMALATMEKTLASVASGLAKLEAKMTALEDRLERHIDPKPFVPPKPAPFIDPTAGMMAREAMNDMANAKVDEKAGVSELMRDIMRDARKR
jgi:hypothetical protein